MDGFGDLVEVAENDEVFPVPILPKIRAVHEMLYGAIGFRAVAEQIERVINMARDGMGELLAFVRGNIVPARVIGAREFGGQFGASFVGFDRAEQGFVIGDAVGAAEVLKRADFFNAAGFEFKGLEQEFFLRCQTAPKLVSTDAVRRAFEMFLQTERHKEIHGGALGLIHHVAQNRCAALPPFLVERAQFLVEVNAVNAREAGDDFGGDGLGGKQVIRVRVAAGKIAGLHLAFAHVLDDFLHPVVDLRDNHLGETHRRSFGPLAQNHVVSGLNVIADAHTNAWRLGGDAPNLFHLQSSGPHDEGEVFPHVCILVGKHEHLQTVVRHLLRQTGVTFSHRDAERRVVTFDGVIAFRVGIPLGETRLKVRFIPREEILGEFLVVHRISVRRVGDPEVAINRNTPCVTKRHFRFSR